MKLSKEEKLRKLDVLREIVKQHPFLHSDDFFISDRKDKRFKWWNGSKFIHFGLWPYLSGTFIDHQDRTKRQNWRKRHSKIKLADGRISKDVFGTASYLSWNLLW
jgi:hypothetical protein